MFFNFGSFLPQAAPVERSVSACYKRRRCNKPHTSDSLPKQWCDCSLSRLLCDIKPHVSRRHVTLIWLRWEKSSIVSIFLSPSVCVCFCFYWFVNPYSVWPPWLICHTTHGLTYKATVTISFCLQENCESGTNILLILEARLRCLHKTFLENILSTPALFKSEKETHSLSSGGRQVAAYPHRDSEVA